MAGIDSNVDHLGLVSFTLLGNLQAFLDVMSSTLNVLWGLSETFTFDEECLKTCQSFLRFSSHFGTCQTHLRKLMGICV